MGMRSAGGERATRPIRSAEDEEWDEAGQQSETRVVNVSPYPARVEIATVPGSRSRRQLLQPGEGMMIQSGYCFSFIGEGRQPVRATIESNTEREAWPGKRITDKDGKLVWAVLPGPRLPMVVAEGEREATIKAAWDDAMARRQEAVNAPLRMTLQRSDGTDVEVEASIEDPPRPAPRRAPLGEVVEQGGELDEPPPEHDDPLPGTSVIATDLPVATAPAPILPPRAGKAKDRDR